MKTKVKLNYMKLIIIIISTSIIFINSCANKTVDDNIKDLDKDFENLRESYDKCDFCEMYLKILKISDELKENDPEKKLLEKKYELMQKWFENNFNYDFPHYITDEPENILRFKRKNDCSCLFELVEYRKKKYNY